MFLLFLLLYSFSNSSITPDDDPSHHFPLSSDISDIREVQHNSIIQLQKVDIFENASYAYSGSNIAIWCSRFSMNRAYGHRMIHGSGGAIFAYSSNVLVQNSIFLLNSAVVGGAISLGNSNFFAQTTRFVRNIAKSMAGSIFSRNHKQTPNYFFYMQDVMICLSKSAEFYGAVYIENSNDTSFDKVNVFSSRTKNAGGGIAFKNSNVYLYKSQFKDNSVGTIIDPTQMYTTPKVIFYYRSAPNVFINTNPSDVISDSFESNNNVPHINFNTNASDRLLLDGKVLSPFIHFIYTDTLTFSPDHNLLILKKNANVPLFSKDSDEISFVINSETIINIYSENFTRIDNGGTNVYISNIGLYTISQTVSNIINIFIEWSLFLSQIDDITYTQIDSDNNRYIAIQNNKDGNTHSITIAFEGIKQSYCQKLSNGIINRYENNECSIHYGHSGTWIGESGQSYFTMKKVDDISQLYFSVRNENSSYSTKSKVLFSETFHINLDSYILESYIVNLSFYPYLNSKFINHEETIQIEDSKDPFLDKIEHEYLTKIKQGFKPNSTEQLPQFDAFPSAPTFSKRKNSASKRSSPSKRISRHISPQNHTIQTRYSTRKSFPMPISHTKDEVQRECTVIVHFLNQSCFNQFKPTELSFFFNSCFADINIISIFDEEIEFMRAPINANTIASITSLNTSNFSDIISNKVNPIISLMINSLPSHITNCTLYIFIPSSPEVSIPSEKDPNNSKSLLDDQKEAKSPPTGYAKGGGSVFFTGDDDSKFELITNGCSFMGNRCIDDVKKSNDMLFSGNTEWKSYMDIFSNPKNLSYDFVDESIDSFDVTIYNSQFGYPMTDLIPGPKSTVNIDGSSNTTEIQTETLDFNYVEPTLYPTRNPSEQTIKQTYFDIFTKPPPIERPVFPGSITYLPTLIYSMSRSQSYEMFFTYSLIPVSDTTYSLTQTVINNQATFTHLQFTTNSYSYQRIETFSLTIADFPFSFTTLSESLINTNLDLEHQIVKGLPLGFIIGIVSSIVIGLLLIVIISILVYRSNHNRFIPFHDEEDHSVNEPQGEETIILNPILVHNLNSHSDPFRNDFEEITLGEEPKYERF